MTNRNRVNCVFCASSKVRRHGVQQNKQRYRCMVCQKTFMDSTNTKLHRMRLLTDEVAQEFMELRRQGWTTADIAREWGITFKTAQEWSRKLTADDKSQ